MARVYGMLPFRNKKKESEPKEAPKIEKFLLCDGRSFRQPSLYVSIHTSSSRDRKFNTVKNKVPINFEFLVCIRQKRVVPESRIVTNL